MQMNKETLINVLNRSMQDLRQGIDTHCGLVASLLGEQVDEHRLWQLRGQCPMHSRQVVLEEALKEAIEVLEESRKSFKSRRLGLLRKKLTRVLIESD